MSRRNQFQFKQLFLLLISGVIVCYGVLFYTAHSIVIKQNLVIYNRTMSHVYTKQRINSLLIQAQNLKSTVPLVEKRRVEVSRQSKRRVEVSRQSAKAVVVNVSYDVIKIVRHFENKTRLWEDKMKKVHELVYHKFSTEELEEYYAKEEKSKLLFENTLNIEENRGLLQKLFPNRNEVDDRVTDQLRVKLNVTEYKLIYAPHIRITEEEFKKQGCNVEKCNFTRNKSLLPKADVVSHRNAIPFAKKPLNTKNGQLWIFSELESPLHVLKATLGVVANWTATYRRDSVINTPYERFTPWDNMTSLPLTTAKNYALGKTKMVAWFVSNCGAKNTRLEYAKNLKKHLQVDMYGRCGDKTCPRTSKKCFEDLKTSYKFYLSFENSNCKDYVTEKLFWNALNNDILPIVMGASIEEYKRIAPPHSFIHVDDFASPEDLADYLKFLDKHDSIYNQYFLWKNTGEFINTKFVCRLCAMIHLAPYFPMWYTDVNQWWGGRNTCRRTKHPGATEVIDEQSIKYGYMNNRSSIVL